MKATGIVRRIDDLGRIVIPKEIRRSFRIKEGDPLEIFTDAEGEVIDDHFEAGGNLSVDQPVKLFHDPARERAHDHRAEEHRDFRSYNQTAGRERSDDTPSLSVYKLAAGIG